MPPPRPAPAPTPRAGPPAVARRIRRPAAHELVVCLALLIGLAAAPALGGTPAPAEEAKSAADVTFLVLPITSDEEGLGDKVGEMLRFKAKRLGAVVFDPKSIAENLGSAKVSADMPPAKLADLAREKFKADLAVTGHVKGKGPYEVRLVAVHAADPKNLGTFDRTYACSHHQVVPLEMAKAVYDILGLPQPEDPLRMLQGDAEVQRRWRDGPNLVKNPGFELTDATGKNPADWQALEDQMAWVPNPDGAGKVLKYDMNQATAETYGLDFYSDWIAIEPGATYRFSCRYKSLGPTPKVFLKGYFLWPGGDGYAPQWRESYRRQVHPSGPKSQWNSVTADFVPDAFKADQKPLRLKVDLYAYYPAGVIFWDDIVLKKVHDAPPKADGKAEPADKKAR
jgi:hypothetical protein